MIEDSENLNENKPDQPKIQIDFQAEQQAFNSALQSIEEKILVEVTSQNAAVPPPSITYIPTPVPISEKTEAEAANVSLDLKVKFDPEEEYKILKKTVENIQEGIDTMANEQHDRWIPLPRALNSFEERPTLEQTNLIFDQRRDRFSEYPKWA